MKNQRQCYRNCTGRPLFNFPPWWLWWLLWLFFRGFSGASTFILKVLAVGLGASPGDVAALGSINTVVAAMLGRVFLGEPLGWAHGCAVGLSVSGAVLVSQPSFLFESSTEGGAPWLGYIMAALAGFTQACVFISVRKSESVSLWLHLLSPVPFLTLGFVSLPLTPLVDDLSMKRLEQSPLEGVGIVFVLLFLHAVAALSNSTASKLCPAALSATVNTSSSMIFGYLAQTLLFDDVPNLVTICGATLMLSAIVIMAVARSPSRSTTTTAADKYAVGGGEEIQADDDRSETDSLSSFIAAEFSARAGHVVADVVRQRRAIFSARPAAQQIGAMVSVVAGA
jgi:drug/metabolite transporter (DMT)-like permease